MLAVEEREEHVKTIVLSRTENQITTTVSSTVTAASPHTVRSMILGYDCPARRREAKHLNCNSRGQQESSVFLKARVHIKQIECAQESKDENDKGQRISSKQPMCDENDNGSENQRKVRPASGAIQTMSLLTETTGPIPNRRMASWASKKTLVPNFCAPFAAMSLKPMSRPNQAAARILVRVWLI